MLTDEVRRCIEAAIASLSPKRAQELPKRAQEMASSVLQGEGRPPFGKVAQDLVEWSNRNRERVGELVRTEVRSQMKQLGLASRDEVDSLRRRVRELEKAQGGPKRTSAKRATAKRAPRTTAKRSSGAEGPAAPVAEPAVPVERIELAPPAEPATPAGS